MMKNVLVVFLLICSGAYASDPYPKNHAIDVKKYIFNLEVNDSTDVISGKAFITILFRKSVSEFELDLMSKNNQNQGMEVSQVLQGEAPVSFSHKNNRLKIVLKKAVKESEQVTFQVIYHGVPQDGLIIGKNKFGDRGFFGDNWPDRGHNWLPVVDHPSDKAAVDFVITAPLHYSVVANGLKTEESFIDARRKLTRWHEEVEIPVKVMVVGIARFAVEYVGKVDDISVQSWVYPQNKAEGFYDYSVAVNVLDFFHHHIGPYPFKKLANVQSKTRWGGLENASAIFYFENSVTGKGTVEPLIAHEEAHQWFGNSATESDWHHVWLSEGFATYFTNLYLEHTYGHDRLVEEQITDRQQVIEYYRKNPSPVVDTTITDISKVLNTNTYQKAGWVLHMLRHEVGDYAFWKGIRQYYTTYHGGNALTSDFRRVMEEVSGKDLSIFFSQWLYQAGQPKLSADWTYDAKNKAVILDLSQSQKGKLFQIAVDIEFEWKDKKETKTVLIQSKTQKISFPYDIKPDQLGLDPGTWLLYEGEVTEH